MTTQCSAKPGVLPQQLATEKALRRWANLSLGREMLIAVGLLALLGLVLSTGFSALDLIALR